MRKGWLKKIRVVLSLLFFFIIGAMFVDFTGKLSGSALHAALHFQFIPSILLLVSTAAFAGLGFLVILLVTLLVGRVYCSTLCPLGTLQDIFSFISEKLSPRRKIFRFRAPLNGLRYGITGLLILSLLTGSMLLVNILDPYSAFGKMAYNLFRSPVIFGNNLVSRGLASAGIYSVYPVNWVPLNYAALTLALAWAVMLLWLAAKRGRLYCNTVCPVGTVLGFFARASLFRIALDQSKCNSCGLCSAVCKAECIDPRARTLDFSRCVGCMNCLSPCPDGGVKFVYSWDRESEGMASHDPSKRSFIKKAGALFTASALAGPAALAQDREKKKEVIRATVPVIREFPVTPPGAVSQARFNSFCTACQLCVAACPTHVLQPTYFLYGLKGFLQPRMDYITSYCNFDCTVCGEVCPTGAILPLTGEAKKQLQIGKVVFVKENCVVYTNNTDCGACSEHCPTKAVKMVPYTGTLTIPEVEPAICVGCGACEYACPTDPKSIYVEGNPVHLQAEKPKEEELEMEIDYKEEFPF